MDITYVSMAQGFCYLAVVVGRATRRVLAHELSISMDSDFCVRVMEAAMRLHGVPEIVNTDQGFGAWGDVFGDRVIAAAILDRLLHHAVTLNIRGNSYRLKDKLKAGLVRSHDADTQPGGES